MSNERDPLADACFLGDVERVFELLEMGCDVNQPDEFGWAPLHRAVESGNVDVLSVLVEAGADCDALTPAQSTAFHIAALHGYTDMAIKLIEADETPNVNEENINGSTPVMAAAFNCNPTMVQILIEQKADVSECDEDGWNPLHFAAWSCGKKGSAEVAELILEAGLDITQRVSTCHAEDDADLKREGATPLELVKRRMKLMDKAEKDHAEELVAVLKKWEDIVAARMAKVAQEKQKKKQYEEAMENAKRRTSLSGRRKASLDAGKGKEGRRASKASQSGK